MSSDIPMARLLLQAALNQDQPAEIHKLIRKALARMTRESPEFRAPRDEVPYLTGRQKRHARRLRRDGMSIRAIAAVLGVNGGRVSEACRE